MSRTPTATPAADLQDRFAATTRRLAIVGTGFRAQTYLEAAAGCFGASWDVVGLCDVNPGRMDYFNRKLTEQLNSAAASTFRHERFKDMLAQTRPDVVLVCTVDRFHRQYIVAALEAGCDVITEKPLATDADDCNAIVEAAERTGRSVRVVFNYRWAPGMTEVKRQLLAGAVGRPTQVHFEYLLDTTHGSAYFRRWHRDKSLSGGLIVHKATHHLDLVNWWLDALPESVFGHGSLSFYGPDNAKERCQDSSYEHYTGQDTAADPFAYHLDQDPVQKALYLDPAHHDGYRADQNVFAGPITSDDTMDLLVKYRGGATLSYALSTYQPIEGVRIAITGTAGRLEYEEWHNGELLDADGKPRTATQVGDHSRLVVHPLFEKPRLIDVPPLPGGHGGADPLIVEQLFSPTPPDETLGRNAADQQGAASAVIGIAANQSFATGQPIRIADLAPYLDGFTHLHELR